ncbi:MAG TPA: DUF116 domain-containing protein [Candidatus Bathyarchaeia archaeon]|nr:DUF116 domain-containing protein [Candidatus Bathyarchaeia archaeon]
MPYGFSFDLTKISKSFFRELARISREKELHKRLGVSARHLAEKFHLSEITGLDVPDALQLVEDLVDVQVRNASERARFEKTQNRALFLPHCSRKYMDNRCHAVFNPDIPSYKCGHCSEDCQVNLATTIGEKKGYDVYVVPGGSCIHQIMKKYHYEGAVGVACGQELKLGGEAIKKADWSGQAIPLIKNGCSNTSFSLKSLETVLSTNR